MQDVYKVQTRVDLAFKAQTQKFEASSAVVQATLSTVKPVIEERVFLFLVALSGCPSITGVFFITGFTIYAFIDRN